MNFTKIWYCQNHKIECCIWGKYFNRISKNLFIFDKHSQYKQISIFKVINEDIIYPDIHKMWKESANDSLVEDARPSQQEWSKQADEGSERGKNEKETRTRSIKWM